MFVQASKTFFVIFSAVCSLLWCFWYFDIFGYFHIIFLIFLARRKSFYNTLNFWFISHVTGRIIAEWRENVRLSSFGVFMGFHGFYGEGTKNSCSQRNQNFLKLLKKILKHLWLFMGNSNKKLCVWPWNFKTLQLWKG